MLVLLQWPLELEAFAALRAPPWPLACMVQHVVLQVGRVFVGLPALCTDIRTLSRVHALVPLHVANLREGFAADLAAKWPLSCMDAEMAAQHFWSCKRLVAQPARDAHAWLLMVALVLFQVKHVHKGLATYSAQVLALTHVIALVPPEEAGVDEALAAHVAHVGARH